MKFPKEAWDKKHTHTHTNIYIYIYIKVAWDKKNGWLWVNLELQYERV